WQVTAGKRALLDREQRCAGHAIEEKNITLFARLRYRCYTLTGMLHRQQHWRRREVAIPYIVTGGLEMPQAPASRRIQGEQTVGEQVVPGAIGAIKVADRRTCRGIYD